LSLLTALLCILNILLWDQLIAQTFADPAYTALRNFASKVTDIGLGAIYFGLSIVVYVAALLIFPRLKGVRERPKWIKKLRYASGFSLATLFLVGLVNLSLKILFGRQRPHQTETFESFNFDPFNFHWHWHSFPSGHTQVVFVVATLLSLAWPRWKWIFLFTAFCLAMTRVIIHQHFMSDIILGAAVGYLGTLSIYYYQNRQKQQQGMDPKGESNTN